MIATIAPGWAWFSSTTIGRWVIGGGAVLLAVGGALLLGRRQGRQAQEQQQEEADHEAYQGAVETRNSVEDRIRRAGDGTSAGRATDCAWARPIYISKADFLTDGTAKQIEAHDETGAQRCGWEKAS